MQTQHLLKLAIHAAEQASKEILTVYHSGDFQAEAKGDNSPLTLADRKAHEVIVKNLQASNLPLLSEEGRSIPYEERKDWSISGCRSAGRHKRILKRNGEFTVNMALIHKGVPILGVVAVPVTGDVFMRMKCTEVCETRRSSKPLAKRNPSILPNPDYVCCITIPMSEETQAFIAQLKEPTWFHKEVV